MDNARCTPIKWEVAEKFQTLISYIVGQFGLQYSDQGQGTLGSLVVTPSLLSIVIESHGQNVEIVSIRD